MHELEKYPVTIGYERDNIIDIIKNQKFKIPKVWEQLLDKKDPLMINSFELGFVTSLVAGQRKKVPELWKQLITMLNKFREDAGVTITELEGNLIQLKGIDGTTIIREKYEWEK
jgi:hypothetical protein